MNEAPFTKLKNIATKIGSGATPRGGKKSYKKAGISLIRSLNVYDLRFDSTNLAFIDEKQASKLDNVKVESQDILLNITGASVARGCMVPDSALPARVNQHVSIIRIDTEQANPSYILYCLVSPYYKNKLLMLAQGGATREALTKTTIENFEVPLPEKEIQNKIAYILSCFDDLIDVQSRSIKILEDMAQSLYNEWFVLLRFPEYENTKTVETPHGTIPEGWEIKRIRNLGSVITGKTPRKDNPENFGNYMPFIKTPDMHHLIFCVKTAESLSKIGAESQRKKTLPPNSVCVSCIGTPGIVSITSRPSQTNQQINSIVLNDVREREFGYFALKALKPKIELHGASGATMTNLSKGKFENLKILYPKKELVSKYNKIAAPMFDEIRLLQEKNERLEQMRDLLLPKLISGEIDFCEIDINRLSD